ncbi:CC020-like protein [Mya arenaria]|uniref:CC020-like protein n=1 Tax=Mya arenaria TaxID=6604 RepID=A0ABY7FX94_MYAAR|nr:CC020-like protein [Mya arenaria]
MSGYNEFTSDVVVVPREWQTQEMKDQYNAKLQQETLQSEEDVSDTEAPTGRTKSRMGTDRSSSDLKSNLRRSKALMGSIETVNELDLKMESRQGKRSDSRMSATSVMRQHLGVDTMSRVGSRRKGSTTVLGGPLSNYAMQTINFQLSNSAFEDKGWIMLKGRQEEVDQNQILEYCVQRLQESLKSITEQTTKEVEQGHDKPVVLRYYGDAKKETLLKYRKSPSKSGQSIVHRGGKPKIPTIVDERNEGKKLMHAQHIDGSAVLYYPSGRPALIHSAAGFGRPGFYTIVYEDGLDSRMIACFTPSGRGVCYHENGVVSFLATEKGGHLAEENGKLIRKWTWPKANVKITEPLSLQVNGQVCFRCVGQSQMTVSFSCQRETARFNVGHNPDIEARAIEEGAARDLMRIFAPNKKRKKTRKHTSKSQSSEIQKLLQDFPDKVSYELEADKDLAKLQRKARILVDDWMEHYRLAVGLIPAELLTVRDSPQRYSIQGRNTKSARMSDQGLLIRRAILAGLGGEIDEDLAARIASQQQQQQPESSEEKDAGSGDGTVTPSAMVIINRMAETASRRSARSRATSARTMSPTRQQTTLTNVGGDCVPSATPQGGRSHCPLVIRQQKLGYDSPSCRCSRHYIPNIMDIELDDFVEKDCPEEQLIVIMVVSSLFPGITKAEEMVNEIYQNQNRNRTRPCVQSRSDMFRVFKYDINSAAEMSNHTQPILLTRHNVVPGIPSKGRHGLRSGWGGEIGGAGVDEFSSRGTIVDETLQPIHRPTSDSSERSKELHLDAVKLQAARYISLSLSSTGFQPPSPNPRPVPV